MKNFKKYIAALLIFILALSLCSCSLIDRLKPAPAPETVRLTFPEGTTVIQAAQKLEEGGVCTKDEFISAVNNTERDNKFVKAINNPQERPFLLEGYIYPDTYDFYVGEGAEKALGRFLANTESKLTDDMYAKAQKSACPWRDNHARFDNPAGGIGAVGHGECLLRAPQQAQFIELSAPAVRRDGFLFKAQRQAVYKRGSGRQVR